MLRSILIIFLFGFTVHISAQDGIKYTGWATENLNGNVAEMATNRVNISFDDTGNITRYSGDYNFTADYTGPLGYLMNGFLPMHISFPVDDETDDSGWQREHRLERVDPGSEYDWPDYILYTFDKQGRIIMRLWESSTETLRYTYYYPDDRTRFPASVGMTGESEGGKYEASTLYRYTDFDENGNWTGRQVRHTVYILGDEYGEYDVPVQQESVVTENAEYTYR